MSSITKLKLPQSDALKADVDQYFPVVDPGEIPLGSLVLLQVKQPMTKTSGGIVLTKNDIETEFDNTSVAKVLDIAVGAFKNRSTLEPWPEGAWVEVGDYVRVSQHNGKRWTKAIPGTAGNSVEDRVTFVLIDDLHLASKIKDPLAVKAFF